MVPDILVGVSEWLRIARVNFSLPSQVPNIFFGVSECACDGNFTVAVNKNFIVANSVAPRLHIGGAQKLSTQTVARIHHQ